MSNGQDTGAEGRCGAPTMAASAMFISGEQGISIRQENHSLPDLIQHATRTNHAPVV